MWRDPFQLRSEGGNSGAIPRIRVGNDGKPGFQGRGRARSPATGSPHRLIRDLRESSRTMAAEMMGLVGPEGLEPPTKAL